MPETLLRDVTLIKETKQCRTSAKGKSDVVSQHRLVNRCWHLPHSCSTICQQGRCTRTTYYGTRVDTTLWPAEAVAGQSGYKIHARLHLEVLHYCRRPATHQRSSASRWSECGVAWFDSSFNVKRQWMADGLCIFRPRRLYSEKRHELRLCVGSLHVVMSIK